MNIAILIKYRNTENIDNALDNGTKIKYSQLFDTFVKNAAKEADEATFRDESSFANQLNKWSKSSKAANVAITSIIPFSKTPANVLKRSIEYSPVGLGVSLTSDRVKLNKQQIDRSTYINNISKGLTGTGVFALGILLSATGLLSVGDDDEDDEAERELLGGQEYALNFGNNSYSIEFLAPAAIPLFMGGKLYETIVNALNGEEIKASELLFSVLQGVAEPMFAQTMLDGIEGAFEAISRETRYNDSEGAAFTALLNYCAENWANQFVPSTFGAVARTTDDTVRTWYTEKGKEESLLGGLLVGVQKKLPVAANAAPAKLDMWGQPISSGKFGERLVENFISPGYYQKGTEDQATKALHTFATENNIPYSEVIPEKVDNYFTLPSGEQINLTAKEYEKYAGAIGAARKEAVEKYLVNGEKIKVEYNQTEIKRSLKRGRTSSKSTFYGNISTATNDRGWAPTNKKDGYIKFDEKGKAIGVTPASDEMYRKMLLDEILNSVTEEAAAKVEEEILAERKKNKKE